MIRCAVVSLFLALNIFLPARSVFSAVYEFSGRMELLITSGKGCEGLPKIHAVTLAFTEEEGDRGRMNGYFVGGEITVGMFSGIDPTRLDVRYPYQEELRATGHTASITRSDNTLVVELRDRHIDADADDCNFDHAHMELTRVVDGDASARLAQLAGQYDAQLTRSQAVQFALSGNYASALPHFEKALKLADTFLPKGNSQINSYLVGLATSYIWLNRFDEFDTLFDTRIAALPDDSTRLLFSEYRARDLMNAGRTALGRDDSDTALKNFVQANSLQPQNRESIAAIMSIYVRTGRYNDAINFLERSESQLENESDRRDIRGAAAMVLLRIAQLDDKDGKTVDAETALKRSLELDPGSVQSVIALARLRHKAGNLADAETILEQALKRFKDVRSQNEIIAARDRMRLAELFLKKIRKAGS
jgi:tetratricopeptide (TPR) repeat protein